MNWYIPLLLLILAIAMISIGIAYSRKYEYTDIDNEADCQAKSQNCGEKNCCALWDHGVCRKATIVDNGTECKANRHIGPAIIVIIGIALFVAFIATFVMAIATRHKKTTMAFQKYLY